MKRLSTIYFFLLLLIINIPAWRFIDAKMVHWLILGGLNTLFISYVLFFGKIKSFAFLKHPILLSFLGLFIIACISTIKAINPLESLVKITDLFTILSSLTIVMYLVYNNYIHTKFILYLVVLSLTVDIILSYIQYIFVLNIAEFNSGWSNDVRGLYGNKNMASIAIFLKIPLCIYLTEMNKNKTLNYFIYLLLVLSFYMLFLQSSRTALLAMIAGILFFLGALFIKKIVYKKSLLKDLNGLKKFFIPIILSFLIFKLTVNQQDVISVEERMASITNYDSDESASSRLRFWRAALTHAYNNPLLGAGIGNWRIYGIKYDSEDMFSYVVPYYAHNDLIEILAETGIFGFLAYLSFFFFIFKNNLSQLIMWMKNKSNYIPILFSLVFIVYFADVNFNFPIDRPSIQIIVLIYLSLLLTNHKTLNSYEKE